MNKITRRLIGWQRLAVAMAYCQTTTVDGSLDDEVQEPIVVELNQTPEQFTHKYLLQQTCTLSVNSSCQMITIALVALSEASQKYKDELFKIMDVLDDDEWSHQQTVDDLETILMESRYDITNAKTFYLDSISAMDSALQLGQSSVQMSFTVGANTVFNSMSERLYTAEKEFQYCIEDIRKVEDKFNKLLANALKKSKADDTTIVK